MERMRSDFQVRRDLRNSQNFSFFFFGFVFDVVSDGNGVNLDFDERKRVPMVEEGKWSEMLHGFQQFWSKGKKNKRLADEMQNCAEIDVDSCRGGEWLRQKDTNFEW